MEKLALTLIVASRKLKHYFQGHRIVVRTTFPLKAVLHKPDVSGRLIKWAIELGGYDITYEPRTAIKEQVLADFVAEMTPTSTSKIETNQPLAVDPGVETWTLSVDGSSNSRGSAAGLVLATLEGYLLEQSIRFGFAASNNEAEYEALIAGLQRAKELGVENLNIRSDSQLVVNQIKGVFEAKDPRMAKYLEKVMSILSQFVKYDISQVPRAENGHVEALASLRSAV